MACKRSAVRSRLAPPQGQAILSRELIIIENVCINLKVYVLFNHHSNSACSLHFNDIIIHFESFVGLCNFTVLTVKVDNFLCFAQK